MIKLRSSLNASEFSENMMLGKILKQKLAFREIDYLDSKIVVSFKRKLGKNLFFSSYYLNGSKWVSDCYVVLNSASHCRLDSRRGSNLCDITGTNVWPRRTLVFILRKTDKSKGIEALPQTLTF